MESGKTAVGVLLGIGVGALLGVLFAPAKGSKTRKRIMKKSKNYADDLKGKFDELLQDVTNKQEGFFEDAKSAMNQK